MKESPTLYTKTGTVPDVLYIYDKFDIVTKEIKLPSFISKGLKDNFIQSAYKRLHELDKDKYAHYTTLFEKTIDEEE